MTRNGDCCGTKDVSVRLFRSLLNAISDMLDPDIPKRLPQQPVAIALGIEPTEEEIATALKAMTNVRRGVEGLPVELLKLGLPQDRTILLKLHRLITRIWREGNVPQHWKDAVITVLYTRKVTDGVWKLRRHLARVTRG